MNPKTHEILLVDDIPSDVELTRRAFVRCRADVRLQTVSDGQEALDYLFGTGSHADRAGAPLPGLVLMDLRLPRLSGHEVLKALRGNRRTRRLPVVILSSSNEAGDLAACYDLGANSYIRKPVDYERFQEEIGRLGRYWLDMNIGPPPVAAP